MRSDTERGAAVHRSGGGIQYCGVLKKDIRHTGQLHGGPKKSEILISKDLYLYCWFITIDKKAIFLTLSLRKDNKFIYTNQ
jgi:hypothetical protein